MSAPAEEPRMASAVEIDEVGASEVAGRTEYAHAGAMTHGGSRRAVGKGHVVVERGFGLALCQFHIGFYGESFLGAFRVGESVKQIGGMDQC